MLSYRNFILGVFLLAAIATAVEAREWTDKSGAFRLEAKFVSLKNGKVYLEKKDGSVIAVELTKLSKQDLEFLQSQKENEAYFREHPSPAKATEEQKKNAGKPEVADKKPRDPDDIKPNAKNESEKAEIKTGAEPKAEKKAPKSSSPNPTDSASAIHVDDPEKVGEVRRFPEMGWGVESLAFSPDGKFLAVGKTDRALMLFDADKSSRVAFLEKLENLGEVTALRFSPDGKKLLAGGSTGRIQTWNVDATGALTEAARFVGHRDGVFAIHISDDGKNVLSGGSNICYWELESGRQIFSIEGFNRPLKACHITKSKKQGLATDGAALALIDLKEGRIIEKMPLAQGAGQTAAISPDGKLVATNNGYNLHVFEIVSGKQYPVFEDKEIQWFAVFTPNGKYLLSGGSGKINLWDVEHARKIFEFDTAKSLYVQVIAASPDGRHFAAIPASAGQVLQIFRLPSDGAAR